MASGSPPEQHCNSQSHLTKDPKWTQMDWQYSPDYTPADKTASFAG